MATKKLTPTFSEEQNYSFPELGVSVEAKSHEEALELALKAKEDK